MQATCIALVALLLVTTAQQGSAVCVRAADCSEQEFCSAALLCTSRLPDGNVCFSDDACVSDSCTAGICGFQPRLFPVVAIIAIVAICIVSFCIGGILIAFICIFRSKE